MVDNQELTILIQNPQVIVIGFSSDIGYALGDTTEDCK